MKYDESKDSEVPGIEVLTENLTILTAMVQTQNEIILCLLHKLNIETDLPTWEDKEAFEKEMDPKIKACIKAVRKIYGRSETDKD